MMMMMMTMISLERTDAIMTVEEVSGRIQESRETVKTIHMKEEDLASMA